MRPEAWIQIELGHRRTEALFRRGKIWISLMLGGSCAVVAATVVRIASGI